MLTFHCLNAVSMPHPADTAEGIAMNEYIMITSNRGMMYKFQRQETERKEREAREKKVCMIFQLLGYTPQPWVQVHKHEILNRLAATAIHLYILAMNALETFKYLNQALPA
jgi:hypothetical protein